MVKGFCGIVLACISIIALTVTSAAQVSPITGFTLVHATTDTDVKTVTDGVTIDIRNLPGHWLNVRVENNGELDSIETRILNPGANVAHVHTDRSVPYTACGGNGEDHHGCSGLLYNGSLVITATPYLNGVAGVPKSVSFSVIGSSRIPPSAEPDPPAPRPAPQPAPSRQFSCTITSPSAAAGPCHAAHEHRLRRRCDTNQGTVTGTFSIHYGNGERTTFEYRLYCP